MTFQIALASPPPESMGVPVRLATAETWHRVDVCNSTALARTQVSLIGVLDVGAIESIDAAIQSAEDQGHTLTLELGEISSITPGAVDTLLTRSDPPDGGRLVFVPDR